jgi:hypothetical protein
MKFIPIPDKYVVAENMYEQGGYYLNHTNANVVRSYINTDSQTSLKYSVSAYTKTFGDAAHISLYSKTGSTSGYWSHAVNYLLGYNDLVKYDNYFSISAIKDIIVININKKNYGDRIKLGSFNFTSNSLNYFSISSYNENQLNSSISGVSEYYNFYPYFDSNNEIIINSSTSNNTSFIGKLFPCNGFAVITSSNFTSTANTKNFIDSITSINWYTEILTTELHAFCIRDPLTLNYSYNPSLYQTTLSADTGYSYGRDGITGMSSQFISTISALSTYATTIGFYNDKDECLMVAKLPQPIKLIKELPYSFHVSLDLAMK